MITTWKTSFKNITEMKKDYFKLTLTFKFYRKNLLFIQ